MPNQMSVTYPHGMMASFDITLAPSGSTAECCKRSIFFAGDAMVLIRYAGFTVLTDPAFIQIERV